MADDLVEAPNVLRVKGPTLVADISGATLLIQLPKDHCKTLPSSYALIVQW